MEVMTNHDWKDADIQMVLWEGHENNRELVFDKEIEAIILNKEDVVALAREFNLVVYEKDANL